MRAWRLVHARWQDTALSGDGAALYPGRWNRTGERVVYLADTLALAVLETLVHLEAVTTEEPCVAIELALPDELLQSAAPLSSGWQQDLKITRDLGSRWLSAGTALALRVPSVLVPDGANVLLNPAHRAARLVEEVRRLPFRWDDRLF
ncbi:MAG TPA: RES family NAD+ phosphorylase [Trueperaceae bacterium]|nr:RES family NAD+ phosphorylase [Trueperaceae bacterium]